MTADVRRRWSADDRAFRSDAVVAAESPVAMDSWLVEDGRTRAPERHTARFVSACAAVGVARSVTAAFLADARGLVPAAGRWFPRVELVPAAGGTLQLQCWLRSAPPPGRVVRLRVHPGPDERHRPHVKGPDQAFLAGCRADAVGHGADDAVLLAADGTVRETSTAALLWWRHDALCAPPRGDAVLASVTADLLCGIATGIGVDVVEERVPPAALDGLEVWAVNALHGIRPVAGWVDVAVTAGPATRAPAWRRRLDLITTVPAALPRSSALLPSIPVRSR